MMQLVVIFSLAGLCKQRDVAESLRQFNYHKDNLVQTLGFTVQILFFTPTVLTSKLGVYCAAAINFMGNIWSGAPLSSVAITQIYLWTERIEVKNTFQFLENVKQFLTLTVVAVSLVSREAVTLVAADVVGAVSKYIARSEIECLH